MIELYWLVRNLVLWYLGYPCILFATLAPPIDCYCLFGVRFLKSGEMISIAEHLNSRSPIGRGMNQIP